MRPACSPPGRSSGQGRPTGCGQHAGSPELGWRLYQMNRMNEQNTERGRCGAGLLLALTHQVPDHCAPHRAPEGSAPAPLRQPRHTRALDTWRRITCPRRHAASLPPGHTPRPMQKGGGVASRAPSLHRLQHLTAPGAHLGHLAHAQPRGRRPHVIRGPRQARLGQEAGRRLEAHLEQG